MVFKFSKQVLDCHSFTTNIIILFCNETCICGNIGFTTNIAKLAIYRIVYFSNITLFCQG